MGWSRVPRDAVARVEVIPGGGATAWGNAALGGAIQILTIPPKLVPAMIDRPPEPLRFGWRGTAYASLTVGDFGLINVGLGIVRPTGPGIAQIFGEDFRFDGFTTVAPERRGPIDTPTWSRHRSFTARYVYPFGSKAELRTSVRAFEEFRGNGTPYQRNGTREKLASVEYAAQPSDHFTWQATGYVQAQSFASTFSAVNADRTTETPASDQYAVPTTAAGLALSGTWKHADDARTIVGVDARAVQGETREAYSWDGSAFARERIAGGAQTSAGVFALHERTLLKGVRLTLGGRLDYWLDRAGHRRERDLASPVLTRDDRYPRSDDVEFSPTVGLIWQPAGGWRLHANAQQSFWRPTLNELYRPFRQGAAVTEANAALKTEHATSGELGIERTFTHHITQTDRSVRGLPLVSTRSWTWLQLSATAFATELRDAVTNVTLARGPGTFPLFGTLGAGAVGRQRLNVDRVLVRGFELGGTWHPIERLGITAAYVYNEATVRRATLAPTLVGKRLPEVPRHSASLGLTWNPIPKVSFNPRLRWVGRQFDDDENTLRLGETVVADVGLTWALNPQWELFLNAENVGDARVETARTADGVVSLGTPRFVFGGIRVHW